MILIADSGTTKTSWTLLSGKDAIKYETSGFNPYYMGAEEIERILLVKRTLVKFFIMVQDVRQRKIVLLLARP
jgi:hypothetical protein